MHQNNRKKFFFSTTFAILFCVILFSIIPVVHAKQLSGNLSFKEGLLGTDGNTDETIDTILYEALPLTNDGKATEGRVQTYDNQKRRLGIAFPNIIGSGADKNGKTIQIPHRATITSAKLYLYAGGIGWDDYVMKLKTYRATRPWLEGAGTNNLIDTTTENGATWEKSEDYYTAEGEEREWSSPGALGEGDVDASSKVEMDVTGKLYRSKFIPIDVTQIVQQWANGLPNYGWVIEGTRGATNDQYVDFFLSDYTRDSSLRPYLEVTYEMFASSDTTPPIIDTFSGAGGTTYKTAAFSWTVASASVDDVAGYEIRYATSEIATDQDFSNATPLQHSIAPKDQTAVLALPGLGGTEYYFVFKAYDAAGNYSTMLTTEKIAINNNPATLDKIELTFQPGDTKGSISNIADATISSYGPRVNYGAETTLKSIYQYDTYYGKYEEAAILLQFPEFIGSQNPAQTANRGKEQVIPGSRVEKADVWFTFSDTAYPRKYFSVHKIAKPWMEGSQTADPIDYSTETGVTWNRSQDFYTAEGAETSWSAPGMKSGDDFRSQGETLCATGDTACSETYFGSDWMKNLVVTNSVRDWVDDPSTTASTQNYGVTIRGTNDNGRKWIAYSSEYSTREKRPMLRVVIDLPEPPTDTIAPQMQSVSATTSASVFNEIDAQWTPEAVSENDISQFLIKYSKNAMVSESDFLNATTYAVIQDPVIRQLSLHLPPPAGTTYYIAIRAVDASGNASNFVTTSAATNKDLYNLPTIEVTFQEDGDSKNKTITKTEDATIAKNVPRWNYGQNIGLWLPNDDSRRTLIQFPAFIGTNNPLAINAQGDRVYKNAEQVPAGVEIVDANLTFISEFSTNYTDVQIDAFPLRTFWREGPEGKNDRGDYPVNSVSGDALDCSTENGATWEKSMDYYTAEGVEKRWAKTGAESASDDPIITADRWASNVNVDDVTGNPKKNSFITDSGNFFDVTIKDAVRDWVDDAISTKDISGNFGILLRSNKNLQALASSEYSNAAHRPMLSVEYKTPARPTETISPTISNFQVKPSETVVNQVDLSWETSDADIIGYDIRYSTKPITTDSAFSVADVVPYHKAKDEQNFSAILPGLPGTKYYFAIKAQDSSGNVSALAQTGPIATNADLYDLPTVEVTFQEGGDCKNSAITKTEDATIVQYTPRWNFGQNGGLYFTSDTSKKNLIQFPAIIGSQNPLAINAQGDRVYKNAEQVPQDVEILNADISLIAEFSTDQSNVQIDAYPLRKPWREGSEGKSTNGNDAPAYFGTGDSVDCALENGVTWEKSEDYYIAEGQEARWGSNGAESASDDAMATADRWASNVNVDDAGKPIAISNIKDGVNFFAVRVKDAVRDWVDDPAFNKNISENFGVLLRSNKNLKALASSEYSTAAHRPMFSVEYKTPARPTDTTPPTLSSFVVATGTQYGAVDFTWTATYDTGLEDIEIRYSQNPITTDSEYLNALSWPEMFDASLGRATIRFFERGGTGYYFAARALDDAKNYSAFQKTEKILSNADRTTLEWIEITAQEDGDCRNTAITKTEDTLLSSSHQSFAAGSETLATIGPYNYGVERILLVAFPNIIGSNDPLNGKSDGSATYYGTEQIPPLSNIRNATLTLVPDDTGTNDTFSAYQMRHAWTEGKFADETKTQDTLYCPSDYGTTWEKSLDYYTLEGDEQYWFSAGAKNASDDPAIPSDRANTNLNGTTAYTYSNFYPLDINIKNAVQDWANTQSLSPNFGVRVDAGWDIAKIRTSEHGTTWQRPMFSVEFDVAKPSGVTLDTPINFTAANGSAFNTIRLSWQEPFDVSGYHIHVSGTTPSADKDAWWQTADVVAFDPETIQHENGIATVEISVREPAGAKNYYFGLRAYGAGNAWSPVVTAGPVTSSADKTQAQIIEVQMQDNRSCSGSREPTVTETQDTMISQTSPDNNYGQNTEIQYGDKDRIRMLLRWPSFFGKKNPQTENVKKGTEQIPSSSTIDPSVGDLEIYQAKLKSVYKSSSYYIGLNELKGYPLMKDWQEGPLTGGVITQSGQEGVTWNNEKDFSGTNNDVPWSASGASCTDSSCSGGADRDATDILDHSSVSVADNVAMDWNIRSLIEQWAYNDNAEKSLLFQFPSTLSNIYKYYSGEDGTERYRPLLRVSYYIDHPPHASFDISPPQDQPTGDIATACDHTNSDCDGSAHVSQTFSLQDFSWEDDVKFPLDDYIKKWSWKFDTNPDSVALYDVTLNCSRTTKTSQITCDAEKINPASSIEKITPRNDGTPNVDILFAEQGIFNVALQIYDVDFETDIEGDINAQPVTHTITVTNTNPIASFEIDPPDAQDECSALLAQEDQYGIGTLDTTFSFHQCAFDPDGDSITQWFWDWNDDNVADATTTSADDVPTRTATDFGGAGTYPVNLQVEDVYHALSTWATRLVTITEPEQSIADAYLQTQHGDVYSAQGFAGSVNLTEPEYNASYYIFTGGDENSVISFTSPKDIETKTSDLGFPNSSVSVLGDLNLDDLVTAPSGVNSRGEFVQTLSSPDDIPELPNGKIYHLTGSSLFTLGKNLTFQKGSGETSAQGTIVVDGDLVIAKDTNYELVDTADIEQLSHLPSVAWIVRGNLIIDPSVTHLSGSFFVFGDQGISTGTAESANDVPLRVDGLLMAKTFNFQRRFHGTTENPEPAELIFNDGRLIANPPPGFSDLASTLPDISFRGE